MVGKTALNKEMKHLNGAYFRTISCNMKRVIILYVLFLLSPYTFPKLSKGTRYAILKGILFIASISV